jgi:hypothetical protein
MGFKFPGFHHWCCHNEGLLGFAPEPNSVTVRIKAACSSKTLNIQIYSVKYYKHFTKAVLYIIFTHKKFIYRVKGVCV